LEKIKKYVLGKSMEDILDCHISNRSPIIKVLDNQIIEPKKISLEGLEFLDWINKYLEKLELVNYNSDWKVLEVPFDEYEDYKIRVQFSTNNAEFFNDIRQLNILLNRLKIIFDFIEPSISNKYTSSLEIRNIILLASMEVETHWKILLTTNDYGKNRLTTSDYVKLKEFINFEMPFYLILNKEYGEINPFKNWETSNPTKSLKWYDAYNKIKHDRKNNLNYATLDNCISSVCAVINLMVIRWGGNLVNNYIDSNYFSFSEEKYSKFGFDSGSEKKLYPYFSSK